MLGVPLLPPRNNNFPLLRTGLRVRTVCLFSSAFWSDPTVLLSRSREGRSSQMSNICSSSAHSLKREDVAEELYNSDVLLAYSEAGGTSFFSRCGRRGTFYPQFVLTPSPIFLFPFCFPNESYVINKFRDRNVKIEKTSRASLLHFLYQADAILHDRSFASSSQIMTIDRQKKRRHEEKTT